MKSIIISSCLIVLALTSCGNNENTGNEAAANREKGPYQHTNDENHSGNSDSSANSLDSLHLK